MKLFNYISLPKAFNLGIHSIIILIRFYSSNSSIVPIKLYLNANSQKVLIFIFSLYFSLFTTPTEFSYAFFIFALVSQNQIPNINDSLVNNLEQNRFLDLIEFKIIDNLPLDPNLKILNKYFVSRIQRGRKSIVNDYKPCVAVGDYL